MSSFYVYVAVHRNKFLFNKTNRRINFPNLFLSRNSTCFGQFLCPSSGIFHCTFENWYMSCRFDDSFQARPGWSCLKAVIKPAWHIPVLKVQWKTPDDGQRNCPKHVEFLDKNKFGKLMRLLVLLKTNICSVISLGYGNLGEENLCPTLARIWPRFLGLWKP